METLLHTEQRHYKIGDDKFHINLELKIDRRDSILEYSIKDHQGSLKFWFANSKPETARKVLTLIKVAVNKVVGICKEEGLHIVLLSDEESGSSNGAQADGSATGMPGL